MYRRKMRAAIAAPLVLGLGLLLGACAAKQQGPMLASADGPALGSDLADPYEATNRELLESNLAFYDTAMAPVVEAYVSATPSFVREGVSNFLDNLAAPRIFINDLLQGEWERAAVTFTRFAFNSTIGFGGLFDRASQMGLAKHDEDFGQTLAVYGVEGEPYLVVPLFGPSNPRDAIGRIVDMAMDPANYILFPISTAANLTVGTVDSFARRPGQLEALRRDSMDFYATLKLAYYQNREHAIRNGAAPEVPDFEDFAGDEIEEAAIAPQAGDSDVEIGRPAFRLALP